MANYTDSDEDDDYGYFQVPVRQYEIVDKIKLANKELFEATSVDESDIKTSKSHTKSVSFREELVEYAPSDDYNYMDWDSNNSSDREEDHKTDQSEKLVETPIDSDKINVPDDSEMTEEDPIEELPSIVFIEASEIITKEDVIANVETAPKEDINLQKEVVQNNKIEDPIVEATVHTINETDIEEMIEELKCIDLDILGELNTDIIDENKPDPETADGKNILSTANVLPKKCSKNNDIKRISKNTADAKKNAKNKEICSEDVSNQAKTRPCCNHKKYEKLPNYRGLHSQYGLCQMQLERRERLLEIQRNQRAKFREKREELKRMEQEANEFAFSLWMHEKARTSKRKHKNMYDVKNHKKKST